MLIHKLAIFLFLTKVSDVKSARILGIFHRPSKSHQILGGKLLKTLAERGHEVTMVSPFNFTEKINNFRHILLKDSLRYKQGTFSYIFNFA